VKYSCVADDAVACTDGETLRYEAAPYREARGHGTYQLYNLSGFGCAPGEGERSALLDKS
jgi:hypothetical protein